MFRRRFLALGLVASVAACGGGGGSSHAPIAALPNVPAPGPTSTTAVASAGTAPASFTISIPKTVTTGAHSRTPRTIPAGTQSVQFTLVKSDNSTAVAGTQTQVYSLTPTSPGCATNASGGITCTLQINAPVGNDIYTADVYATTNGSGAKLGSGTVKLSVQTNATNTASLTLSGTVANIALGAVSPVSANFTWLSTTTGLKDYYGNTIPQSVRVFMIATDAQGNQIIAPDTFGVPVTLMLGTESTSASPTPTPTATMAPSISPAAASLAADVSIGVTYAFPGTGPASATSGSTGQVAIESPADQITVTAISPVTTETPFAIVAEINGTIATPIGTYTSFGPVAYFVLEPGTCPAGDTGTPPFNCVAPTPSPSPTASPAPTPSPTPTPTPAFAWEATAGAQMTGVNTNAATYVVPCLDPSNSSACNAAAGLLLNDASYTGNVTVADAGVAGDSCSSIMFYPTATNSWQFGLSTPLTLTSTSGMTPNEYGPGWQVSFQFGAGMPLLAHARRPLSASPSPSPSPAPTPAGVTCHITVTATDGASATMLITAYSVSGTVN